MIIALNDGEIEQHFFMFYRLKGATVALEASKYAMRKKEIFCAHFVVAFLCFFSSSTSVDREIPQVKLKQTFPFLWRDDIDGRAQWSVKRQLEPKLLNSHQGHLLSFIDFRRIESGADQLEQRRSACGA